MKSCHLFFRNTIARDTVYFLWISLRQKRKWGDKQRYHFKETFVKESFAISWFVIYKLFKFCFTKKKSFRAKTICKNIYSSAIILQLLHFTCQLNSDFSLRSKTQQRKIILLKNLPKLTLLKKQKNISFAKSTKVST